MNSATITWFEDKSSGRGYYNAKFDDGGEVEILAPIGPITAATDSDYIAGLIAGEIGQSVESVDHDGEYIHVVYAIEVPCE